jgi:hypothetical protein
MAMEWTNKDSRVDSSGVGSGSFREHNENMREFRRCHADVAMVNGSRLDEATLLERMASLRVRYAMTETGGSRFPDDTMDWSTLVPLRKATQYKPSQN